jgi:hypothetical protein
MAEPEYEFLTPLQMTAVVMHETYLACQYAGFTRNQAFELTKITLQANLQPEEYIFELDEEELDED